MKMPPKKKFQKTVARQGSVRAQKSAIWKSPEWITRGLAFCILYGQWQKWEVRLLAQLSLNLSPVALESAVIYSLKVLARPWPELTNLLVGLMHGPDLIQIHPLVLRAFVRYARYLNERKTLENRILAKGSPAAAFVYAAYGTRRRWPAAEALILSGDTAATPALSTGIGDFLDVKQWTTPWESQAVTYARLFLNGRWPALEDKMLQGECHPQVAPEYAVHVLQGPLPQPIETWLMLAVCDTKGSDYRQRYFAFKAAKKSHTLPGNTGSSTSTP